MPYQTLRALNNLMVVEAVDGMYPLAPLAHRGYELAQRIRHGALLVRMVTSHAGGLFSEGRIAEAIDVLENADIGAESLWNAMVLSRIAIMQWTLTGDVGRLEEAQAHGRSGLSAHEPQYRSWALDTQAECLWWMGRIDEAFDAALEVPPMLPSEGFRHVAIGAAVRLRDLDRLDRAEALIDIPFGRRFDVLRLGVRAGREALSGDPNRAAVLFGNLTDLMAEVEGPVMTATWKAIFAEVLPDPPEARRAAEEAHAFFDAIGAVGFITLFRDVWDRHLAERAEAG